VDFFPQGEVKWTMPATLQLLRVRPSNGLCVVLTGPLISWYMHWSPEARRTLPCRLLNCPLCALGAPRRALSYCSVLHYARSVTGSVWKPAVLEVPWSTGKVIAGMRGKRVMLRREAQCAQVQIGTFSVEDPVPTSTGFDIVPELARMWRLPVNTQLCLVGNLGPSMD
jgi:hypothetical protein